jgi:hypothetical protein
MPHLAFQSAFRLAVMTFAAILIGAAATPALAIDGRTAVGVCVDSNASGARCAWSMNDKGEIDICNKSGCVYCPSATGECTAARGRTKPTRTLPVGATVKTPLLSVEITGKPFTGSLLRFSCPQGMHSCPGAGCRPSTETCIFQQ